MMGQEGTSEKGFLMIYFKKCPRCSGDLYDGRDTYGTYLTCLQCGCYLTHAEEVVLLYSYSLRNMGPFPSATSLSNAVVAVKGTSSILKNTSIRVRDYRPRNH